MLDLCSGIQRDGDMAAYLTAGGLRVIHVDYEGRGIRHDLASDDVADRVAALAASPLCIAVVASPTCSTWPAARFEPGAPQVLRTREQPMGVPQSDGGLPATVIRPNAIVTNCVRIAKAAHDNNGDFVFESPVSRGADSRFAIEDKSEHADMSTHKDLAQLAATKGV
eukprot:5583951-Pleurochrysis_carterae.AAC.1